MIIPDQNPFIHPANRKAPRRLPKLRPGITVSDAAYSQLPISHFDVVIIMEPDEQEWDPQSDDSSIKQPWDYHCEMLLNEIDPESEEVDPIDDEVTMIGDNRILWIRNIFFPYYELFALDNASIIFNIEDSAYTIPEDIILYFSAAHRKYPQWNIAVMGGLFEDEVTRMANLTDRMGFKTTILTRYCLSVNGFIRSSRRNRRMFGI
jgi:hypothetical protein